MNLLDLYIKGQRCIVIGSAPGVRLPESLPMDVVLAANGGAAVAKARELPIHALLTTSYLFRDGATLPELATLERMRGVGTYSLVVDEQHGPSRPIVARFKDFGIAYQVLQPVPPDVRATICRDAIGSELRVSTGVFAACLAIASGASEVVLCGISLEPGHEGMPWDEAPRDHVSEDRQALAALLSRPNVSLMDLEVAA